MLGVTLSSVIRSSNSLNEVRRQDLRPGDYLVVRTCNSVYSLRAGQNGEFRVEGGWFARKKNPPSALSIRGCTWGGSAIKTDLVAACGLRIEFGNRLVTSPIQKIVVFSHQVLN